MEIPHILFDKTWELPIPDKKIPLGKAVGYNTVNRLAVDFQKELFEDHPDGFFKVIPLAIQGLSPKEK